MNKKVLIGLIVIIVSLVCIIYLQCFYTIYTTQKYSESYEELLNPRRGFYVQFDSGDTEGFDKLAGEDISIVLISFDISEFADSMISEEKLNELENAMSMAREYGLSVIFRAGYGFSSSYYYKDPSNKERIKVHINQIKPILNRHKNSLMLVQAGFIGPWGEWHSSNLENNNGELPESTINELLIVLLDAVPKQVPIALRRPSFIRLLDKEKVDISRISFHNDALLSNDSDMNTYDSELYSRDRELDFISKRTGTQINGGEMPNLSEYTTPEQVLKEFGKLNLTYLNHEYNKEVLNKWRETDYNNENFYQLIKSKLGYKLTFTQIKLAENFKKNRIQKITMTLKNNGFASVNFQTKMDLIVLDGDQISEYPIIGGNLNKYKPGESFEFKLNIKQNFNSQNVIIGLRLGMDNGELQSDEPYFIKLSNEGLIYKDGINYFAKYQLVQNKGNYIYKELN